MKARNLVLVLALLAAALIYAPQAHAEEPGCAQLNLSGLTSPLIQSWNTNEDQCLEISNDLQESVYFHADSGWIFGTAKVSVGETMADLLTTPPTPPDTAYAVNEQRWEIPSSGKLVFSVHPPELPALPEIGLRFRVYPVTMTCKHLEITENSGLQQFSWPNGEGACVEVSFADSMQVTRLEFSGWVFGEPVTLTNPDGSSKELPLTKVPGEKALHIVPFNVKTAEGALKFRFTESSLGREIGLRWNPAKPYRIYLPFVSKPAERKQIQVTPGFRTYTASWGNPTVTEACADFLFTGGGDARIVRGWFFGDLVSSTLNGTSLSIPTYRTLEELATQIPEFHLKNPQAWTICLKGESLEVGLSINY